MNKEHKEHSRWWIEARAFNGLIISKSSPFTDLVHAENVLTLLTTHFGSIDWVLKGWAV